MESQLVHLINIICILCGSQLGSNSCYALAASELGLKLGERKINLVYGEGSHGLNGCVSHAAYLGKSFVVGVIPIPFADPHIFEITRGQLIRMTSMSKRTTCKICQTDVFIALPGDFGTLEQSFV